jgi:hypothetical protein
MAAEKQKEHLNLAYFVESKVLASCLKQAKDTVYKSGSANALMHVLVLASKVEDSIVKNGDGKAFFRNSGTKTIGPDRRGGEVFFEKKLLEIRRAFTETCAAMIEGSQRKSLAMTMREDLIDEVENQLKVGSYLSKCSYIISKHDRLNITKDNVRRAASASSRKIGDVLSFLAKMYSQDYLEFPYKSFYLPSYGEMFSNFKALLEVDAIDCKCGETIVLEGGGKDFLNWDDLFGGKEYANVRFVAPEGELNSIVEHFQEKAKNASNRKGCAYGSLEVYWKDYRTVYGVLYDVFKNAEYDSIETRGIRETLSKFSRDFDSENPSFVLNVVCRFFPEAKRVLDFSAGWGERLVAFLALNVEKYAGFESNAKTKEGHDDIIYAFGSGTETNVRYEAFEDCRLSLNEGTYDLIFTTPAAFRSKDAYDNGMQKKYKTFDRWMTAYLFYSLYESWSFLEVGGGMCFRLKESAAAEPACLFVLMMLEGARYCGVAYDADTEEGLWMFKKADSDDEVVKEKAKMAMSTSYGHFYREITERLETIPQKEETTRDVADKKRIRSSETTTKGEPANKKFKK